MRTIVLFASVLVFSVWSCAVDAEQDRAVVQFDADELEDKIRGGMLGQVIGNLNGLPHEFEYINEPGRVEEYTPSLPDGAKTDDDTDIEWVYLREIARSHEVLLSPDQIAALWKRHINRRIWCANRYARDLMELGFEPPWTGNTAINPWSEFNISGQFICESFGLMAPAMPQTAARIGLNYTHVTIDGEPAQTTQLFTTMIAMAFVESELDRILDAGLAAVDPHSEIAGIVRDVRTMCAANPSDWRQTRRQIRDRWQTHGGVTRDRNGYELNTACTIAALVYGKKDFVETLRLAFNFGWDCDNNAATAATIVGVMKGRRWMNEQGWDIADVYRNTTRDEMPDDETLTGLEDKLIACARLTIVHQNGKFGEPAGLSRRDKPGGSLEPVRRVYRIHTERPANVEPLSTIADQRNHLRESMLPGLADELGKPGAQGARAAYLAICLGEVDRFAQERPAELSAAVAELQQFDGIARDLFDAPEPAGAKLRKAAKHAGLRKPRGD